MQIIYAKLKNDPENKYWDKMIFIETNVGLIKLTAWQLDAAAQYEFGEFVQKAILEKLDRDSQAQA